MIKYIVISLAAVFSNYALAQPLDQIPMYGGHNRTAVSDLKAADEKLIADTTKHYGSKEKASNAFASNGFAYYSRNDSANAMRRFNQAWLIDPSNPEVYWGFGAMMNDLDRHCEAKDYFEKALSFGKYITGLYPDGARAITLCAAQNKNITESDRLQMFARADALYKEALERDIKKGYVHASMATALFRREQYLEAWKAVKEARTFGERLGDKFIKMLSEKMPEPR